MSGPREAARRLLEEVGAPEAGLPPDLGGEPAAAVWARSGALWLTGRADGPPLLPTAPVASVAAGALAALRALAPAGDWRDLDGAALLGERAACAGLGRRGRIAPGGTCRLLRAREGWLAVGMPRGDEDWRLIPAWLEVERPPSHDPWAFLAAVLADRPRADVVARGRLLGLPVAPCDPAEPGLAPRPWLRREALGEQRKPGRERPRVVDLSALWAGPLCGDLLGRAGAEVLKVESLARPDGARRGPRAFFDLLNGRKQSVALDFRTAEGRVGLRRLVDSADLVLEASRPRALQQLGIDAERWVAARPGRCWLSLTGYGRGAPQGDWVAMGDDAAAAAGLPFCVAAPEAPVFVGDAIADPLAGLLGALAALASWRSGGGELVAVALRDAAAACLETGPGGGADPPARVIRRESSDWVVSPEGEWPVLPPRARRAPVHAAPLGAHNTRWLCAREA